MSRRFVRTIGVFALAVVVAGCGGKTAPGAVGSPSADPSTPDVAAAIRSAMAVANSPVPAPPRSSAKPSPGRSPTANPSPSPPDFPWDSTLPVEATLSPVCVSPGGTMSIVVQTRPGFAVAYNAEYAGTHGGAPPPYGSGYGGNDKGYANPDGVYRSTWVVSPQATVGPARVDVIVANGEAWGYDNPDFAVAGPSGRC
jgi:hypothetical protein